MLRRWAWLMLFSMGLALAACLVVASRPQLESKLPRIEVGLTRTEVEALTGGDRFDENRGCQGGARPQAPCSS
jgi:hypothetical protein